MTTMTTIPVTTTVTTTTTVELPNGESCELPWTLDDRTDVAVVKLPDGGYRLGTIEYDEYSTTDPMDDYDQGERIELGRDYWRFDLSTYISAIEQAGGIGHGRRVFLVDSQGHSRRDRLTHSTRWIYIVPEDVPAEARAAYTEAVWAEWRAWANGETYGVLTVDVNSDGTVRDGTEDACWGYNGYENAENELQFRMEGE